MERFMVKAGSLMTAFLMSSVCLVYAILPPTIRTYHFQATEDEPKTTIWTCFPIVDSTTFRDDIYRNSLGYMFGDATMSAPLNDLLTVQWQSGGLGNMMIWDNLWINLERRVWPQDGYKLTYRQGTQDSVTVQGFAPDPNTQRCKLRNQFNTSYYAESWVGYFLPQPQSVGQAFSRHIDSSGPESCLDYLYVIKTQNQATCRVQAEKASPWIIDPCTLILQEGDMAVIKVLPDSPQTMLWNTERSEYRQVPRTSRFKVQHAADYTPIFIEFDPNDLPEEVGLYVSGVCKGAAVVDSTLMEVNYYGQNAKGDEDIEIMFYYGGKGMRKASAGMIYNPETMLFAAGSLKAGNLGDYGYVSFNRSEGSSLVPLVTELKQNYPNPFARDTQISWILDKDASISVDIYNLRGQKVRTLFRGPGSKGRQSMHWDARDNQGNKVASGVYFYRLETPSGSKVQKMLVLK